MATAGLTATLQLTNASQIGAFDERCVIAWDGSLRAGRAVRAALPLLPRFKEVSVLAVDARNRTLPLDIGSYLAANGVAANVVSLSSSGEKIGQLILEEAQQASLLVMGITAFQPRWNGCLVGLPRRSGKSASRRFCWPIRRSCGISSDNLAFSAVSC